MAKEPPIDREPSPGAIAEALKSPGGWVYEFVGVFGPNDDVPPEAIYGAWKVGEDGKDRRLVHP